jgi:hypothetical protein
MPLVNRGLLLLVIGVQLEYCMGKWTIGFSFKPFFKRRMCYVPQGSVHQDSATTSEMNLMKLYVVLPKTSGNLTIKNVSYRNT